MHQREPDSAFVVLNRRLKISLLALASTQIEKLLPYVHQKTMGRKIGEKKKTNRTR